MSLKTLNLDDRLYGYLLENSLRETRVQRALREYTATMAEANMQISPEQGQFMQMLVRLTGARRCLEIGTFTGYSALSVALALPADGQLVACDISEEWTAVAREHWERAGVADSIDLRIGPALETLDALLEVGQAGRFDFIFVDADKAGYADYYARGLDLLRSGGLLAFDNTLWAGAVADPAVDDEDTQALRALNRALHQDDRITLSMVPIGDGLTLARKR